MAFEKALEQIEATAVYSEVLQALKDVKASKIQIKDRELILRTALPEKAHLGFRAAGLHIPGDLLYLSPEPEAAQETVVATSA